LRFVIDKFSKKNFTQMTKPKSMSNREIYILGVGRNTEVYIELAEACGFEPVGLYHYNNERTGDCVNGIEILGSNDHLFQSYDLTGKNFAVSVGDIPIRKALNARIRELGGTIPSLIHPKAEISKYAKIEEGVAINACSIVQPGVRIKKDTVVTYNATIAHASWIGRSCYITSGSIVGAYVEVQDCAFIGMGAVILPEKVQTIGQNAVIGSGSVVTKDVEANTVMAGNPAKFIRRLK